MRYKLLDYHDRHAFNNAAPTMVDQGWEVMHMWIVGDHIQVLWVNEQGGN